MTTTDTALFWGRIDRLSDGCWLWPGPRTRDGYGVVSYRHAGRTNWRAHRLAYTLTKGPIPEGLDLDHLCRVRACVRPDHLEPVTRGENVRRGWDAGRRRPWLQPGEHTPARSYKPPPELYERFRVATTVKGETMTNVLVRAIEVYVTEFEREREGKR